MACKPGGKGGPCCAHDIAQADSPAGFTVRLVTFVVRLVDFAVRVGAVVCDGLAPGAEVCIARGQKVDLTGSDSASAALLPAAFRRFSDLCALRMFSTYLDEMSMRGLTLL